jgi:bifunctional non-homologous end joining protein LigD
LPSFPALQDALAGGENRAYVLYAFDLLHLDGRDLRPLPLIERKAMLAQAVPAPGVLRYSEHFDEGTALFRQACAIGLEGIISKRPDAPYRSGRGRDWLKVKRSARQEFVIAAFLGLKAMPTPSTRWCWAITATATWSMPAASAPASRRRLQASYISGSTP